MPRHIGLAITLLTAVGRLFLVNGVSIGGLLLFLIVPSLAYLAATRGRPPLAWIAESFLVLIAMGVILASFDLLPPVLNEFPKLPRADNRLLSFYLWSYLLYVAGIMPPYAFGRSLWHHSRGERADVAPFICWLALATWALCMAGAVGALIHWLNGGFKR